MNISYNVTKEKVNSKAIAEWTEGSGIRENLALVNLENTIYGLWEVFAVDPNSGRRVNRGQRKTSESNPKYRSFPAKRETDAIPLALDDATVTEILIKAGMELFAEFHKHYRNETDDDLGFYRFLLGHPQIPVHITEGVKKAACLLSRGYAAIALPGVWNGGANGQTELKPVLREFCTGRDVYLVFDSDFHTKPQVWDALKTLSTLIQDNWAKDTDTTPECKVVVWDESLGKGVDDLVVQNGDTALKTAISKALTLAQWERQFPKPEGFGGSAKGKLSAVKLGSEIAEDYRDTWAFNDGAQEWMQYRESTGTWEGVSDGVMESSINSIIKSRGITTHSGNSFIANILGELKRELRVSPWNERSDVLPFTNCCVLIETGEIIEHSPGHRLTWHLPRAYDPLRTNWDTISEWLDFVANGDTHKRDVLVHFAAATLRGRYDLQKFIHLIGRGNTGKSTYTNLLAALVGEKNTAYLTLSQLNNEHSLVDIQFKRLLVLPDQDTAPQQVGNFKNITGGDRVSARRLYKEQSHFIFKGMVAMTSNNPTFKADLGTWLTRRQTVLYLNREPEKRRDLMKEFESELGAFTQYLLSVPKEQITAVLQGDKGVQVSWEEWESMQGDSVASFVEEHIVHAPGQKIAAGNNQNEWSNGDYDPLHSTLFGAYAYFCKGRGQQMLNSNNFRTRLLEVCKMIPGWEDVERPIKPFKVKGKSERGFIGIQLRWNDECGDRPSEILMGEVTPEIQSGYTIGYTSEPLQDGAVTVVTPNSENSKKNNQGFQPRELHCENIKSSESGVTDVTPVTVGTLDVPQSVTSGVTTKKAPKYDVGDVVEYVGENDSYKRQYPGKLPIVKIIRDMGEFCAALETPSGTLSTWIPLRDVRLA
jgi:putative DNA primase/helicase